MRNFILLSLTLTPAVDNHYYSYNPSPVRCCLRTTIIPEGWSDGDIARRSSLSEGHKGAD